MAINVGNTFPDLNPECKVIIINYTYTYCMPNVLYISLTLSFLNHFLGTLVLLR